MNDEYLSKAVALTLDNETMSSARSSCCTSDTFPATVIQCTMRIVLALICIAFALELLAVGWVAWKTREDDWIV
jgi:hypothetical protein